MDVSVIGIGLYLPEAVMSAQEISEATKGRWTAEAVKEKLGIIEKIVPGKDDGTQEMAVHAAKNALGDAEINPKEIDVILCMGEEWKEYPLTTSALYIQGQIGAVNAWGIDVQNRCCTTVSTVKMAKDMLVADEEIDTIMVVGGYRNGDFVDYEDPAMSMMYNLSAGAGALILRKNVKGHKVLGSHIVADGTLARDAGVEIGGTVNPISKENLDVAYKSLRLMNPVHMKERLNDVSMDNWYLCIDRALEKSGLKRSDVDYLAMLHIKRSMHKAMLDSLGLEEDQSIYLEKYGHMGQVDQILSLALAREQGKLKAGDKVLMIAAGIGYVWAASVIEWGGI